MFSNFWVNNTFFRFFINHGLFFLSVSWTLIKKRNTKNIIFLHFKTDGNVVCKSVHDPFRLERLCTHHYQFSSFFFALFAKGSKSLDPYKLWHLYIFEYFLQYVKSINDIRVWVYFIRKNYKDFYHRWNNKQ